MAYSKVILNGTTLMDVTQKTVVADKMLDGYTALKNDGTGITGSYVAPTFSTQSKTVSPTTSQQTVQPDAGYDGLSSVIVNAMPVYDGSSHEETPSGYTVTITLTNPVNSGEFVSGGVYDLPEEFGTRGTKLSTISSPTDSVEVTSNGSSFGIELELVGSYIAIGTVTTTGGVTQGIYTEGSTFTFQLGVTADGTATISGIDYDD